jgi:uncharacterized protein (DUF2236 family)
MGQEALGLLGGGRAVLLQLAHPLVAAGVAQHSNFQSDPLERLLHTLELMHTLVFEPLEEAEQALRRFHAVHARIKGRLRRAAGRFSAGTPYRGDDPELKLWVAATLIDTSLLAYERFVRPLSPRERQEYYQDALRMGRLLAVPDDIMPPGLGDFRHYMAEMLAGDTLVVDGTARRLADDVLWPEEVGIVPAACAHLLRFTTAGLLPRRFRDAYGLTWRPTDRWKLNRLARATRFLRPIVPVWVWQSPQLDGHLARLLLWGMTGRGAGEGPRSESG